LLIELLAARSAPAIDITDFIDFSLRSDTSTLLPGRLYIPPAAVAIPPRRGRL